jgi:geranylgeranyl reductase family protein
MAGSRFDVVVVGAGPAGSVAAFVLARGGARVALVDKARFPRDKACGDLVGPRGVRVLSDLGLEGAVGASSASDPGPLGDMLVVGPTGRRVTLPSAPGMSYPGYALAIPRVELDASLRDAAAGAGAETVTARAEGSVWEGARVAGVELSGERRIAAEFVIGADGATSAIADAAGLVDHRRALWGFALRAYLEQEGDAAERQTAERGAAAKGEAELPAIVMWEPAKRRALCGYGWVFPGPRGRSNLGLGVGTLGDRKKGAEATRLFERFFAHMADIGIVPRHAPLPQKRLGGWLKMGMAGTNPAGRGVLLVGDAAGLVNPLQGEGIAHAMTSGRCAAETILSAPGEAEDLYRRALRAAHLPYQRIAAVAQSALLSNPLALSAACRLLTAAPVGDRLAEGWAVFWNELLDGAPPGRARTWAARATTLGTLLTARAARTRGYAETSA